MKRSIGIILLCLPLLLVSQQKENEIVKRYNDYKYNHPSEYAYLNTDKRIYYSGGYLKFNLAVLNQYLSTSELSKVAYLQLIHESGEYERTYPFRLQQGLVGGGIELPMDIPTGNYQLVAFTHFMRNFNLDDAAMRQSIYVQNTSDTPKEVVENFYWADKNESLRKSEIEMNVNETKSKVLFEINAKGNPPGECFIVSEGFGMIQFVGKIRLRKPQTNFSIDKSQLKGNFQKIILLNDQLDVIGGRGYYLSYSFRDEQESTNLNQPGIGQRIATASALEQDSMHLFKRTYQLYYHLPPHEDLSKHSLDELTSSAFLKEKSIHVYNEWKHLLSNETKEAFSYTPEKNLHIRRDLIGDLGKLEGGYMTVHFFDHDLDMLKEIDDSGQIDLELGWAIGDDLYLLSLFNADGKNISEKYEVNLADKPAIAYQSDVSYYDRSLTDSIISQEQEFQYVLSTFNKERKARKFFWDDAQFNQIAKVEDFRGLRDFEEFIREAVLEVTVTKKDGQKSLAVYNSVNGYFEFPQMLILNDQVINNAAPLFDIPLEELISVNAITSKERLADLGLVIAGGIIVVLTKKPIEIPDEYINKYFGSINGFLKDHEENSVSHRFNSTLLFEIYRTSNTEDRQINPDAEVVLTEEQVSRNGTYIRKRIRN